MKTKHTILIESTTWAKLLRYVYTEKAKGKDLSLGKMIENLIENYFQNENSEE